MRALQKLNLFSVKSEFGKIICACGGKHLLTEKIEIKLLSISGKAEL
jgi:hypothetical protein